MRQLSRRRFLVGTAVTAGSAALGRAPAALGQQVKELQVWHTEVEPQTVKTIQDTSIAEFEKKFPGPGDVTAFRPDFAVHGKFGQPCPECGTLVQRIRYAENETNYCPRCQTEGKLLADRSLSRLLKDDWPKTVEEWEESR